MKINDILSLMNENVPLSLSTAACDLLGAYDNSGLILQGRETETDGVVFALDLNKSVCELAKKSGYKLIITHHPAIYRPVKSVMQGVYTDCIEQGVTVYSSHLSLDTAVNGIDDGLAKLCGGENITVLEETVDGRGFGRSFEVTADTFGNKVKQITEKIGTTKYIAFGDSDKTICKTATFCGAGLDEASVARADDCEMLVSADIPHHVLLAALEKGKCVLQLTHYASEAIAMRNFAEEFCQRNKIKYRFYLDERFM